MAGIKFNTATKELEIKGPESFIESNFDKIMDLLTDSLGIKKKKLSRKTKAVKEPILSVETNESQTLEVIDIPEVVEVPETVLATEPVIPEVLQERKVKRPPLRIYIRDGAKTVYKSHSVDHNEQVPERISLASLKEKFGLSQQKSR